MNTEKAIDLLDNLIGMIEDNQENDYDTAFHMAIDALKAQAEHTKNTRKRTRAIVLADRLRLMHITSIAINIQMPVFQYGH